MKPEVWTPRQLWLQHREGQTDTFIAVLVHGLPHTLPPPQGLKQSPIPPPFLTLTASTGEDSRSFLSGSFSSPSSSSVLYSSMVSPLEKWMILRGTFSLCRPSSLLSSSPNSTLSNSWPGLGLRVWGDITNSCMMWPEYFTVGVRQSVCGRMFSSAIPWPTTPTWHSWQVTTSYGLWAASLAALSEPNENDKLWWWLKNKWKAVKPTCSTSSAGPIDTFTLVRYSDMSAIVAVFFVSLDAARTSTPPLRATRPGSARHPQRACVSNVPSETLCISVVQSIHLNTLNEPG